jgi:hypothetical protein
MAVFMRRGSSGSIVSDYELDNRGSIPDRGRGFFSSPCVPTGSGAHPASYPMGTGCSFLGGKAQPGRDADHSSPSSAEVKYESSYTSSPPCASMACSGTALLLMAVFTGFILHITALYYFILPVVSYRNYVS